MVELNCEIVEDGKPTSNKIKKKFNKYFDEKDFKNGNVNFVGFIIDEDKMLISFPKKYMVSNEYNKLLNNQELLEKHMKKMFNVILKCSKNRSKIGIDINKDLNNNGYPFKSFFEIYDYYLTNQLYSVKREQFSPGYSGKVDWKRTLKHSSEILSDKGVVFLPMITKKSIADFNFITKCMAYAINHTLSVFKTFLELPPIQFETEGIDWTNKVFITSKLRKEYEKVFKDDEKRLVQNLIHFFSNKKTSGKKILIKFKSFELVWEEMIKYYLENYLNGATHDGFLCFSKNRKVKPLIVIDKPSFSIEKSIEHKKLKKGRIIKPDYYFKLANCRYILDSKYYKKINGLDYKQISYYFLLKTEMEVEKTYNVLLLPTSNSMFNKNNYKYHINLDTKKFNNDEKSFIITEQYININDLMDKYLK